MVLHSGEHTVGQAPSLSPARICLNEPMQMKPKRWQGRGACALLVPDENAQTGVLSEVVVVGVRFARRGASNASDLVVADAAVAGISAASLP